MFALIEGDHGEQGAYEDEPIPAEIAAYRVVEKVDLWTARATIRLPTVRVLPFLFRTVRGYSDRSSQPRFGPPSDA